MTTRGHGIAILFGAWLTLCAATSSTPPTLAGVAVGSSVLDVEKRLGFPNVAETTDYGSFWQWSDHDGLDREIYTDDDLVVESILVAPAQGGSTAQPSEAPMLGADVSKAAATAASIGAGPTIVKPSTPGIIVWPFGSGYLAADTDGKVVLRLRALDATSARRWRYAGDPLATPPHSAATMVKEVIAPSVPAGAGLDLILVNLDATGKVTGAKVLIPSGLTDVDRFALDCVRLSTFKPATCAGVPCAGTYLYSGGILH